MLDQIPTAPVAMQMPPLANAIIAGLNYTLLLIVTLAMIREAVKTRSALPLLCLAGGAVACLMEPIFDVLMCVWYPQYGQVPLFRNFGISVPIWLLPAYAWYISGQGYLMYRLFQNGITAPRIWVFYVMFYFSDILLESPGLMLHIYAYYGPQPLEIFGLPLWMAASNAVMPLLLGVTYKSLSPLLRGPAILIAAPLVPTIIGTCQIATGWPTWYALHAGEGLWLTTIASFITIGLSAMITYLIVQLFAERKQELLFVSKKKQKNFVNLDHAGEPAIGPNQ
jgi:hypothetical protein